MCLIAWNDTLRDLLRWPSSCAGTAQEIAETGAKQRTKNGSESFSGKPSGYKTRIAAWFLRVAQTLENLPPPADGQGADMIGGHSAETTRDD
jgi:hypothetical protein